MYDLEKNRTPCLTELGVSIGEMFFYMNNIWIRIDTYSASSVYYGTCRFGDIEEDEFKNIKKEAKVLNMKKVEKTLKRNLINIKK